MQDDDDEAVFGCQTASGIIYLSRRTNAAAVKPNAPHGAPLVDVGRPKYVETFSATLPGFHEMCAKPAAS
jgi:hypothetical protein